MSDCGIFLFNKKGENVYWVSRSRNVIRRIKLLERFKNGGKAATGSIPNELLEGLRETSELNYTVIQVSADSLDSKYQTYRKRLGEVGQLGDRKKHRVGDTYKIMSVTHPQLPDSVHYIVFSLRKGAARTFSDHIQRSRKLIRDGASGQPGGLTRALAGKNVSFCSDFEYTVLSGQYENINVARDAVIQLIATNDRRGIKTLNRKKS